MPFTQSQHQQRNMPMCLIRLMGKVQKNVKRLFIKDVFDTMHISTVVSLETADQREGYAMAYAKWTGAGLTFPEPSILLDGGPREAGRWREQPTGPRVL